ncbi:MAG: hypothetical protein AB7G88_09305, partial [Thermomicrobiales bacterium]
VLQIYEHPVVASNPTRSFEQFWQEMMTWQFGHPRAVRTPEGDALVAWYAGDDSATSMHWARIAFDADRKGEP